MSPINPLFSMPLSAPGELRMEVNPFKLTFSGHCKTLEKKFLDIYAKNSIPQIRLALILGIVFYAFFGLLDMIIVPEFKNNFWYVRYGIVCPILLLFWFFSYSNYFLKHLQLAMFCPIIVAGYGIIYMTVAGNLTTAHTYYTGLILVLMITYTFCRARFLWATTAGLVLVASYALAASRIPDLPGEVFANNLFFCVTANLIGMLACYTLEYYARRDFFMSTLLEAEHKRVESAKIILEQKVQQRTALLAQANEELRKEIQAHQRLDWEKKSLEDQLHQAQKMEAVGTLAGGIAHDFNNILAAIMGHTELAVIQKEEPAKMEIYLDEVLRACDRAKDLVGQILAFSRHGDSELKPIQISIVIKEAMRLLRASLPTTITIEKDIRATQSIVVADATQIHQILMNLCTNASHAMATTGGLLRVTLKDIDMTPDELGQPGLSPSNLAPGKYICLSVSDTGHGIPPHLHERIFDPYFTTKAKGVGTGLGLAVVRGIVQNHGGIIQMYSQPGEGTTFQVYLPRADGLVKSEYKHLRRLNTGNERILLVDDDIGLAELGAKLLTTLGYRVVSHTDPKKALQDVESNPAGFDLIITDMIMPAMNGESLARRINKLNPKVPIIIYTGFSDVIDPDELNQVGVKKVLRKPITIYGLSIAIRQVLENGSSGVEEK